MDRFGNTKDWRVGRALSEKDIWRFIAVLILAGIHDKDGSWETWWSQDPKEAFMQATQIMSRNEFCWVLRNIHLADSAKKPRKDDPDFDPAYKLRAWFDVLNKVYVCVPMPSLALYS